MKVLLYALADVHYYSFYIEGFYERYGKENVRFSCNSFPRFPERTFAVIISNGHSRKKIIIDAFDTNHIFEKQFEWSDVYGKVNYNKEIVSKYREQKIIPIGPAFGIRIWSFTETINFALKNYFSSKERIYFKRNFFSSYWRQFRRLPLSLYLKLSRPDKDYVFFLSSLWEKEEQTNSLRARFISCCKELEEINFEGGFAPRSDGQDLGYGRHLHKKITLKKYLKKMRKSAVVFNTPAVQNCHGWKLAEYLAVGKPIITTPFDNILPTPLIHREHVHFVSSEKEEMKEALEEIMNDLAYRRKLETQSREYFQSYLMPLVVVEKLLQHINHDS